MTIPKIKVMFDTIVVSANKKTVLENGIILPDSNQLLTKQEVLVIGSNVRDVEVGDKIEIDTARFPKKKIPAKYDVGEDTYEVIPPLEQVGSEMYLFLDSRAIKWIYDESKN